MRILDGTRGTGMVCSPVEDVWLYAWPSWKTRAGSRDIDASAVVSSPDWQWGSSRRSTEIDDAVAAAAAVDDHGTAVHTVRCNPTIVMVAGAPLYAPGGAPRCSRAVPSWNQSSLSARRDGKAFL